MADVAPPPFRCREIYLDTNVLLGAGWPRASVRLENVLSLAKGLGVSVYIPEAVQRELAAHWMRSYDDKRQKLQEQLEPVKKYLDQLADGHVPLLNLPDRESIKHSYRLSVEEIQQKWGIKTAPIPARDAANLLDMAIAREVAFGERGANFQDSVIFLSVLDHITEERTTRVFISADNIFKQRKPDLEKLAADRGVVLKIYESLDPVATELLERRGGSERELTEIDTHKATDALEREMPSAEKWLNLNRFSIELLRERYPARDYIIKTVRIAAAVPTLGEHRENEKVGISAEVEVEIIGIVPNRPEVSGHAAYLMPAATMPGMDPYAMDPSATEAWNSLGGDVIQLEAEATFTGPTYINFEFSSARLRDVPPLPIGPRLQLSHGGSSAQITPGRAQCSPCGSQKHRGPL